MAEEEDSKAEVPEAKKGKSKGKGKGPAGPVPAKGKSKGSSAPAAVPAWQKPEISSEWQVERMVNWQPIRQTSRLEGSVWQQVHDSLDGQAAKLPENLLERFMRKVSEVQDSPKKRSSEAGMKKAAATKRLLSSKQALVADIHHALLMRKGFRSVDDLTWILGPAKGDDEVPPEEVLEALQGLLGAAVGEERSLTAAQSMKDSVPSELFLRQLLEREPLQELQLRVQLNLDMARFNPKANDLESGLDLALTAAWTIIDSKAMPVLLEGILLLGNSVNFASKNLGGAVGVTLESLTKLAHTRCLPAKQPVKRKSASSRVESALEVLALHLDQATQGFIANLISDLDACQAAKDFDHKLMASLVQELAEQVGQVQKQLRLHPESHAPCVQAQRLQSFLSEANARIEHLQTCLEEIDEATVSLRQWFAEPATSSLHDMLRALGALRKLLPCPKQSEIPPPQDYRLSSTRKRRLEEKKKAQAAKPLNSENAAVTLQIPEDAAKAPDSEEPETSQGPKEADATPIEKGEDQAAEKASEAVDQATSQTTLVLGSVCEVAPPSGVLPQILSWSKGTVWISWLFDWTDVHRGFEASADKMCAFEVLQFSSDCATLSQAELSSRAACSRWRCPTAPLKMDVPLGCHYVFAVRAILLKDAEMLWASSVSSPVTLDLRYSTSPSLPVGSPSRSLRGEGVAQEGSPKESSPQEKSPSSSPRRGRIASDLKVASEMRELLSSGGSPLRRSSRLSPRPSLEVASQQESPRPSEQHQAPEPEKGHVESLGGVTQAEDVCPPTSETRLAESPVTIPKSNDEQETDTTVSGLSMSSSSPQDFDDVDEESLVRLMRACMALETSRTPKSSRTSEASALPASAPEMPPPAAEISEMPKAPAKARLSVPRAISYLDDEDVMDGILNNLANMPFDDETQNRETEHEAAGSQVETDEIPDGAQVLAQIQRQFESKCKACNGTGKVGLLGYEGWGYFPRKCPSCSK